MGATSRLIVQIVISVALAALAMPGILYGVPALRGRFGCPAVALSLVVVLFVVLRVVWPRQPAN